MVAATDSMEIQNQHQAYSVPESSASNITEALRGTAESPGNMAAPSALLALSGTEHDRLKRRVQHWFRLKSLADVDLAIGPNTQVLAIAGDAVLKFQIVNRLFRDSSFTSSAKAMHEESLKYITNRQLALIIAWQLDIHKLLRIYNFVPTEPSKAAIKRLGTAIEALLGVLALKQPADTERVVSQMFCMIGQTREVCITSPAASQLLATG